MIQKSHALVATALVSFLLGGFALVTHGAGEPPPSINSLSGLIERYDSSSCMECHEEIYGQWEKSHHARPLMGLKDWIFLSKYLKEGPLAVKSPEQATKANFPCAKCHLPQLYEATDKVAAELATAIFKNDKETVRKLNIGCLVCHQEKAAVHYRPQTDAIYGVKGSSAHEGKYKEVKQSSFMKSPLFCGQCHGLGPVLETEHPVQCAMLYGSYLHAYIPAGGTQSCQDCHMPDKDHTVLPNYNNREETSARLAQALPMDVQVLNYTFQPVEESMHPMIVLKTKITNKAGHRFPDG
ncbi:MAG: multiheme c-type cytochrome (seleno)protein ExtKL [Syntrophobacteraceae bacterium]